MSMNASVLPTTKKLLRAHMKQLVKTLDSSTKLLKSDDICKKVMKSELYKSSGRVALYLAMNDEVQTDSLIKDLLAKKKKCFIPKYSMDSRYMDMIRLSTLEELSSLPYTKWNIQQPGDDDTTQRENALDTGGLDLIIVPGMAFTLNGKRMGRGKGYYDTYLHKHEVQIGKRPKTMGLAFSEQVLPNVPTDEHDYILDLVISDYEKID